MINIPAPDPKWLPFMPWIFGILITLIVGTLAAAIAFGKVDKDTSYGLEYLLGSLSSVLVSFGTWAFGRWLDKKNPEVEP
jgi:hypothetical protein